MDNETLWFPMCRKCGWAMGGIGSWNGHACKCGYMARGEKLSDVMKIGEKP